MKVVALLVGVVLLALGIAGFVPSLNEGGMLFGVVPANPVMCGLFIATGIVGILIGVSHRRSIVPNAPANSQDMRHWM